MKDIKDFLVEGARNGGICLEGYNRMKDSDLDQLIEYYIQNPDWCLERNFPDLQTLSTEFANIQHKGVYINHEFNGEVLNDLQAYIFHNCKGIIKTRLNVEQCIIPMFYFGNNCDLAIECEEDIHIPLYIFGENNVTTSGGALFNIYRHKLIGG